MSQPGPYRCAQERRILRRGRGIPVQFRSESLGGRGYIRNLTQEGLFVCSHPLPRSGEEIKLMIRSPDGHRLRVSGLVWWTTADGRTRRTPPGFGVRLLEPGEAYLRLFARLPRD